LQSIIDNSHGDIVETAPVFVGTTTAMFEALESRQTALQLALHPNEVYESSIWPDLAITKKTANLFEYKLLTPGAFIHYNHNSSTSLLRVLAGSALLMETTT
jgi:hypothetical protein